MLIITFLTYLLVGVAIAEKAKPEKDAHYFGVMVGWPFVILYRLIHND